MLSAITASTGFDGTWTNPSVASPSVMLCATVNAVTVFTSRHVPVVRSSRASTNSRWSMPEQDVLDPERRDTCRRPPRPLGRAGMTAPGCCGVRRWTHVLPSVKAMRTSASVRVCLQAGDAQGLPAQAVRPQAPGLHGGVAGHPGRDRGQGLGRAGEGGIERQAQVADHRRLPQHAELAGAVLAQVEIGGSDFVTELQPAATAAHERDGEEEQPHRPHLRMAREGTRASGRTAGSATIWYFRIRPA